MIMVVDTELKWEDKKMMSEEKRNAALPDEELKQVTGGADSGYHHSDTFCCKVCGRTVRPASEDVWNRYRDVDFVCVFCLKELKK